MKERFWTAYEYLILNHPRWVLAAITIILIALSPYAQDFKLDASADSLVLENDDNLRYYREHIEKYNSGDFLAISYSPQTDIFTTATLAKIKALVEDLSAVDGIEKILSIIDVPLLNSPLIPLEKLAETNRTLETPDIDFSLAKKEFLESPLYKEFLLSKDGKTTMLLAYLERDKKYFDLLNKRSALRQLKYDNLINPESTLRLQQVEQEFNTYKFLHRKKERQQIVQVREVLDKHRETSTIFLSGVPMIVTDMVNFIRSDLINFGIAITLFLIVVLAIIFRALRWILLPMLTCSVVTLSMISVLGLIDWQITVVSVNFVALLLIITMSMSIHLIVRYQEQQAQKTNQSRRSCIQETMRFMFKPCIYTSLTTIVAFVSLLVSGIRPVIDFGYIMTLGITFAFIFVFLIFPAGLMVLPDKVNQFNNNLSVKLTTFFANLTRQHYTLIIVIALALAIISVIGILQLKVENRFIDYFRTNTEIHQGMLKIDRELGGTTSFDVIIDMPAHKEKINNGSTDIDDELDDILGAYDYTEDKSPMAYWLNARKFEDIKKLHQYFNEQEEIGKVLSLATLIQLFEQLNGNQPFSDFEASFLGNFLSTDLREILYDPYLSENGNQLRFNMRIFDSKKTLERNALIEKVDKDLQAMGYNKNQFRLSGMLVLYNNMLQSLYQSQILTLGMVFLAIMLMFIILFRSFMLAIIAIIPNLLAAGLVLGLMGWVRIPLDIMTITIAAISVGIAVDNTIHYIIRFKREFLHDNDYFATIRRCHNSIGRAVYYTSSIIIIGFSTLTLSNFIPSVYFGLLTALAMFVALIASLTLLPSLLIIIKPMHRSLKVSNT